MPATELVSPLVLGDAIQLSSNRVGTNDFDKVHIRNQSYSPRAHGEIDNDQVTIRKGLIALLRGESSLQIRAGDKPGAALPQLPDARAGTPPPIPK